MASSSADVKMELCSNEEETNSLTRSSSFNLSSDIASMLILSEPPPPAMPETPPDTPDGIDDHSIEEAKTRVAERFFLKKSKRFCGPRLRSAQPVPVEKSRVKSLMSSLRDSVKTTLANSLPRTKTLTNMTNTLITTLRHQKLPGCLKMLGIGGTADRGVKRKRNYESEPKTCFRKIRKISCDDDDDNLQVTFAKPRVYDCNDCNRTFFIAKAYLKHIKRHARFIRCKCCYKIFGHVVSKRRHELQCVKRAIL